VNGLIIIPIFGLCQISHPIPHLKLENMKQQNILIAHPSDERELSIIKAFFEALKIKFEVAKDLPYNPAFVDKILQGDADFKAGKGKKVTMDELNKSWK
jgi:hypothetical protein